MSAPVRLDPRTKLALIALVAVAVFVSPGLWYEAALMALVALLALVLGRARIAGATVAVAAVFGACSLGVAHLEAGVVQTMLASFLMFVRKVLPCGMLAALVVSTTQVNEFMSALARLHAPRELTIPLAVMLRYVPAIREDWGFIRDAMRMRGVALSAWGAVRHPARTVTCLYVPLLMSASRVADELSMASIARGIKNPAPRTCVVSLSFSAADAIALVCMIAVVAAGVAAGVGA